MKAKTALAIAVAIVSTLLVHSISHASDAILIEFSSQHCGPCRAMQPVLQDLERGGVPIRHVDVGAEPHVATRYGIRETPTFVIVSGGKELTRLVGVRSADELLVALRTPTHGPLVPTGVDSREQDLASADLPRTRLAPVQNVLASTQGESLGDNLRSEPMPSITVADAIQRAQAATVRLRVYDGEGHGAGTGTIIDTHGEEALVLTCGHLFRDTQGQGRIEVDLFIAGQVQTVAGQLIDYDAADRDIALVAIRPTTPIEPVKVIRTGESVQNGEPAFSFGCDRGDDPSRRDTRITGIDKYNQHLGVSNLEIAGAPIDGRSGGGLFNAQGQLIGVCNAADYKGDVGIYAGPGTIQWQLSRANLGHLFAPATGSPVGERIASLDGMQPTDSLASENTADTEVIVILRDRQKPESSARVMTVREPNADFMRLLQQHAQ